MLSTWEAMNVGSKSRAASATLGADPPLIRNAPRCSLGLAIHVLASVAAETVRLGLEPTEVYKTPSIFLLSCSQVVFIHAVGITGVTRPSDEYQLTLKARFSSPRCHRSILGARTRCEGFSSTSHKYPSSQFSAHLAPKRKRQGISQKCPKADYGTCIKSAGPLILNCRLAGGGTAPHYFILI
ncbi:hypothetical protein FB451DRAFT_1375447 [Mycena latifolia]|nr:hypothetical protein FB451DRAFT_1375447 [Mycena latifolia]